MEFVSLSCARKADPPECGFPEPLTQQERLRGSGTFKQWPLNSLTCLLSRGWFYACLPLLLADQLNMAGVTLGHFLGHVLKKLATSALCFLGHRLRNPVTML